MSSNEIWRYLCDTENLAVKLPAASAQQDGITLQSRGYGELQVKAKPATATRENYLSDGYLVSVVEKTSGAEHQAFIKVLSCIPMLYHSAVGNDVYLKEIAAYKLLHPMLRELRDEAQVEADSVPLKVPTFYHGLLDEQGELGKNATAVVIENLNIKGFEQKVDKKVGASYDVVMITLEALASYHALSIALVNKWRKQDGQIEIPESLKFLDCAVSFQEVAWNMFQPVMPSYVILLKHLGQEQMAEWFESELKHEAPKAIVTEKIADCEPLVAILHSDAWINNMLYRYDEETHRANEICLIDWQLIRIGHPAIDVLHFLYTSTSPDIRKEHLSTFMNHYYDTLAKALTSLQCTVIEDNDYSRERFMQDVNQRIRYGLYCSLMSLPSMHGVSFSDAFMEQQMDIPTEGGQEMSETFIVQMFSALLEKIVANKPLCERFVATLEEMKLILERNDQLEKAPSKL